MNTPEKSSKQICIHLTDAEIAAVRDITKVDAIAPGIVAIVRHAIVRHGNGAKAPGDA